MQFHRNRIVNGVLGLVLVSAVPTFSGCALDAGGGDSVAGDEAIGAEQQAFSGIILQQKSATVTSTFTIATDPTQACFLAGVGGRYAMMTSNRTGARITKTGSTWQLTLRTENNAKILAAYACVNPVNGLTAEVSWSSGNPSAIVAAKSGNRRCFLTRVESVVGGQLGSAFEAFGDNVRIQESGNNWVLGGSTSRGKIEASARCLTYVPNLLASYSADAGETNQGAMMVTGPGQGACFLEGVKGAFIKTNDINDGIINWYNGSQWFMQVKNAKTGWARCGS